MNKRVVGIDVARAVSIIGMIIVNFRIALGGQGTEWMEQLSGFFDGKASATFVTLAGVGIAFMTNSAVKTVDAMQLKAARMHIIKRSAFLFVVGLSYYLVWPADILHYYAIYMLILVLLLRASGTTLLIVTGLLVSLYPLLLFLFSYETAWDFTTFSYQDFWTPVGFVRNLFFNGFHPVVPWLAFMVLGLWFGRQDLTDTRFLKKTFVYSLVLFLAMHVVSYASADGVYGRLFGLKPMPPLPVYMIVGCSFALIVITGCIIVSRKHEKHIAIRSLKKTGQLALTFYLAHVIIGMGVLEELNPSRMGTYPIEFALSYAVIFAISCIVFAVVWTKYRTRGPLEWIMRRFTG
ncbi:MAG: DUF418 domain-containing protein [Candidatus Kapabacteria bacterium]|nr:DUF418 domain-containing protein [Candidatus Kapabacteria bacterium]